MIKYLCKDGDLMKSIFITTEYITLGNFLKFAGICQTGGHAKIFLMEEYILVNNEEENRRGKKLYNGDIVEVNNEKYKVINEN